MKQEPPSELGVKLNALIALALRQLTGDVDFSMRGAARGTGDIARYLANLGLDAKDIAAIVGSPVASVRTLLTPKRQKRGR